MGQLDGKTAVVTGGTTGIGLATARRFVSEGAYVVITGRRPEVLTDAVTQLGGEATGVVADVAVPADMEALFAQVAGEGRGVDVLFANAGIVGAAPLAEVTEDFIDPLVAINFKGVLYSVQKALPYLSDGASVILTGSTNGTRGPEGLAVYSAIKAAVRSLARTFANELRGRGVRVNVVSPGITDTPGIGQLSPDPAAAAQFAAQIKEAMATQVPLGRVALPEEVANAVLFLASAQSSYITGAEIVVDGGANQI